MNFPTVKDGLAIHRLAPADTTYRGRRTFELQLNASVQSTAYYRYGGEEFGEHFHTGSDPSKSPEIFQLLSGMLEITAEDRYGGKRTEILDACDGVPVMLIIQPYILHRSLALSDVIFIEYRTTAFDRTRPDTYPAGMF